MKNRRKTAGRPSKKSTRHGKSIRKTTKSAARKTAHKKTAMRAVKQQCAIPATSMEVIEIVTTEVYEEPETPELEEASL